MEMVLFKNAVKASRIREGRKYIRFWLAVKCQRPPVNRIKYFSNSKIYRIYFNLFSKVGIFLGIF